MYKVRAVSGGTVKVRASGGRGVPGVNAIPADDFIAGRVADPASATATALSDAIEGFNVRRFGIRPANSAATNNTGLTELAAAVPDGGGVVVFPEQGVYQFSTPLPDRANMTYRGPNRAATELRWVSGSMLTPAGQRQNIIFERLRLSAWGSHLIDLGGAGYLANCTFRDCWLTAASNTASIVKGVDGCGFQENLFDKCLMSTQAASTVSPFDITSSGGKLNGNDFRNITATRGAEALGAFFKFVDTNSPIYNMSFRSIVGQLNPAGLIHITGAYGLTIENVIDGDMAANAYTASMVKIDKAAGGNYPGPLTIRNVGNRGGTMTGSVHHVEITAAMQLPPVLASIGDNLNVTRISLPAGYGASMPDASGASGALRTLTASTTLNATRDGTAVFNGTTLTATLPDPTTVMPGRAFRVKNINASSLTVASDGTSKTIDGAASVSLAQWAAGRYISDGTQWLTV